MSLFCRILMIAATCFLSVGTLDAADTQADIKARMKTRVPSIRELKTNGTLGENAEGYLAYSPKGKQSAEADAVMKAENADRQKVYTAIGKQQGTTAAVVGKRRALQLASEAKKGEWIQENGKWIQK